MPKLIIDGLEIEVPIGTKVIDAAERLGIMIPRFCYHEGLGAVGACRMCAVKFLQGPLKGVQMSCMVEAQDGMVVSTTDEEAVAFRKFIIECLMLNHPHDCPVCDEGGQCLLQDETVSGGHGVRRYPGEKRTHRDQTLGPFIAHEMNRCIHCYRCTRFYQEFTGYRDLGVMQIGARVYFGRFEDGVLESPFAGNLVDLCPTGVYTDKPSRFRARYWDMQRSPSVCVHCSLGCHTTANARYREVLRVEARVSDAVNGHFICDRGRYGFAFANRPDRPRKARLAGREAEPSDVLGAIARGFGRIQETHGKDAVAAIGSGRAGVETLLALRHLCAARGWAPPVLFTDSTVEHAVAAAVSRLTEELAVSLRGLEGSDCIVAVGVDPLNEAPMLAMAMRQASRKGARIVVIDPRPVQLPMEFVHLPLPSADLEGGFTDLLHATLSGPGGDGVTALEESRFPVIVCGTSIVPPSVVAHCAEAAAKLRSTKEKAGLFYVLPEPNSYAAALLSAGNGNSFAEVVRGIENGRIRGLVVVETDLSRAPIDPARLERVLDRLEWLVVLDHAPTPTVGRAHAFIPTANHFETVATFVNQEGRVQAAEPVHAGGRSIDQEFGGSHPARVYGSTTPGSDPKPAGRILGELAEAMGDAPESGPSRQTVASSSPQAIPSSSIQTIEPSSIQTIPPASLQTIPPPSLQTIPPSRGDQGGCQNPTGEAKHPPAPLEGGIAFGEASSLNASVIPAPLEGGIDHRGEPVDRDSLAAAMGAAFHGDRLLASSGLAGTRELDRPDDSDTLANAAAPGCLVPLLVDWTYGTEELSGYSPVTQRAEKEPCLTLHADDAAAAGLSDGDRVRVALPGGAIEILVRVCAGMTRGIVILPRHHRIPWRGIFNMPGGVPLERFGKTGT